MERIPSKDEILMSILPLQAKQMPLTLLAYKRKDQGDLQGASQAFQELISILQQHLQMALLNNRHYPGSPFELNPILNPLIDNLMVYADLVEAGGDFKAAQELRASATGLANQYNVQTAHGNRSVDVLRQQAVVLTARGEYNTGISMYIEARNYYKQKNDPIGTAEVTAEMADALEWLGDYERALTEIGYATGLIEPLLEKRSASQANIFSALLSGQLEQAMQSASLLKIYMQLLQTQARIQRYLGNFDSAEALFQKVFKEIPAGAQPAIDFQFAMIQIGKKNYQQGLQILNRIEPVFNSGLYRAKRGAIQAFKAEVFLGLNQPEEALKLASQAVPDLAGYHDLDMLWKAQFRQARALQALGRNPEALLVLLEAGDTINLLRKTPLGYRLDSTYLRDKMPVFESAIALAAAGGEAEICCRLVEMVKSRTLTAALSVTREVRPDSSAQDRRFNELSHRIDTLEYQGYMNGWSNELQNQINNLLAERADMLEQIRISDPRWRTVSEPVRFDLQKVLALLNMRHQAALNLFFQSDRIISILLKDGKASVDSLETGPALGKTIADYVGNLQVDVPRPEQFDPALSGLSAEQLIPAGLLRQAVQSASLVIVPHGPLHLLPWAGLLLDGKRLFEYCPIGIAPNLSSLPALQTDFVVQPRVALIGGPDYSALPRLKQLYLAAEELQTIQEIYAPTGRLIGEMCLGDQATEPAFWALAQHQDSAGGILHVCCHGNFVSGDPLNAGLLLSDAKVDAAEIARTRLRYDEVILSACSTGYRPTRVGGIVLSGDDILGLPGAFLEAGARSVLVSIPPARDDAALQFMTLYHEQRAAGKTPLFALRETQLTMLAEQAFAPALWIGFTVYGFQ